jgi:uncharacterized protein YaiE (UPF0345 family)
LRPVHGRGIGSAMLKHNTYFDGMVQSVGFERNGRRASVGVVDAGEFAFDVRASGPSAYLCEYL